MTKILCDVMFCQDATANTILDAPVWTPGPPRAQGPQGPPMVPFKHGPMRLRNHPNTKPSGARALEGRLGPLR